MGIIFLNLFFNVKAFIVLLMMLCNILLILYFNEFLICKLEIKSNQIIKYQDFSETLISVQDTLENIVVRFGH